MPNRKEVCTILSRPRGGCDSMWGSLEELLRGDLTLKGAGEFARQAGRSTYKCTRAAGPGLRGAGFGCVAAPHSPCDLEGTVRWKGTTRQSTEGPVPVSGSRPAGRGCQRLALRRGRHARSVSYKGHPGQGLSHCRARLKAEDAGRRQPGHCPVLRHLRRGRRRHPDICPQASAAALRLPFSPNRPHVPGNDRPSFTAKETKAQ